MDAPVLAAVSQSCEDVTIWREQERKPVLVVNGLLVGGLECFGKSRLDRDRNYDGLIPVGIPTSSAAEIEASFSAQGFADALVKPVSRFLDFLFRIGRKQFD
jgi:hypothetical protein